MTQTTTEQGTVLHLQPNLLVRKSFEEDSRYQVSWGQGSEREHFQTDSADLAACLATMPEALSRAEAVQRFVSQLGVDSDAAAQLVDDPSSYNYWMTVAQSSTAGERMWRDVEWDDALGFHMATRNMIWSHDYSGDPKVMTRYHVEHNVQPETEPPTRYRPVISAEIALPQPALPEVDFNHVICERRTGRDFRNTMITLPDLSTLLAWTFQPQFPADNPKYYTTQSYSRGMPFSAFIVTGGAGSPNELEQNFGIYHYNPERHSLGLVRKADELDQLDAVLWRQNYVNHAPAMLVICADWPQFSWKYRFSRAYRFALTECGAFMHTALLVGTALGMTTFQTPAINDKLMCQTLNVKDHEVGPIYVAAFGRPS